MRIALPTAISPAVVADRDPGAAVAALDGVTMGTTWRVMFARPPAVDLQSVRSAIVARLDSLVAEMSNWEAGSLLSRFNRAAAGQWLALPPDFAHVIGAGLRVAAASGGAFDPAIGRLVDLWGFGSTGPRAPPSAEALDEARARSGWRQLAYDAAARRLRQPGGLALDLSGIAKGHAVDVIAHLLAGCGIRHCLVEIGGELAGRGIRPDGDPWWVDLEDPPGVELAPLRIALHDLAVATSGDYRRGAHTIDPRSGGAIGHGATSVSAICRTALEADAWATALTVLGARQGMETADRIGLAARVVAIEGGVAREHVSAKLAAMIEA